MYRRITAGVLAALFALTVYRAATLSFTTDEAFSYELYIGAGRFSLLRVYDANLHLLHTLLVWASVKAFGLSEWAFRLPSLGACGLYFAGVYRLCGLLFGRSAMFLIAAVALIANPLVLDHMAIGRGYGLALACFAWAFAEAVRVVQGTGSNLFRVAVGLALSVASNLTLLFPALGLAALLILWRPRLPGLGGDFAGPATVFTFLLVVLPFSRIEPGQFYFGSATFTQMNQTLAEMSIGGRHLNAGWVNAGAALLFAAAVAATIAARRRGGATLLAAGTFALTAGGVVSSHFLLGLPLPWGRTGLYLLFLATLFLAAALPRKAAVAVLAVMTLAMAGGISTNRFLEWTFDAGSREMVMRIRERTEAGKTVRIAASPPLQGALGLYRTMYRLDWITEIGVDPIAPGFDYYVLRDVDRPRGAALGLREIFADEIGGAALATPATPR